MVLLLPEKEQPNTKLPSTKKDTHIYALYESHLRTHLEMPSTGGNVVPYACLRQANKSGNVDGRFGLRLEDLALMSR